MELSEPTTILAKCAWCGTEIDPAYVGPCPNCGRSGKIASVGLSASLKVSGSLAWEHRREYLLTNKKLLASVVCITILSPLLGLYVTGFLGLALGVASGLVTLVIGLFAVMKVREITRGSG